MEPYRWIEGTRVERQHGAGDAEAGEKEFPMPRWPLALVFVGFVGTMMSLPAIVGTLAHVPYVVAAAFAVIAWASARGVGGGGIRGSRRVE